MGVLREDLRFGEASNLVREARFLAVFELRFDVRGDFGPLVGVPFGVSYSATENKTVDPFPKG